MLPPDLLKDMPFDDEELSKAIQIFSSLAQQINDRTIKRQQDMVPLETELLRLREDNRLIGNAMMSCDAAIQVILAKTKTLYRDVEELKKKAKK